MTCLPLMVLVPLLAVARAQMGKPSVTNDGGGTSGTISMGPPDLSDEETQANFMPPNLRCDACMAIAARFSKSLQAKIDQRKSVREGINDLSEDLLIEMFETMCSDKEWSGYGIKEVEGVKHIVYPGSEAAEIPGIMQGGGPWPRRLSDMCFAYVGEHDEFGIYKAHKRYPADGVIRLICSKDCNSTKSHKQKSRPKNEL